MDFFSNAPENGRCINVLAIVGGFTKKSVDLVVGHGAHDRRITLGKRVVILSSPTYQRIFSQYPYSQKSYFSPMVKAVNTRMMQSISLLGHIGPMFQR